MFASLALNYYIHNNISREISIEHPSVGLASLAQLQKKRLKSAVERARARASSACAQTR